MNCSESQNVLQEYLDGAETPDRTALDLHLSTCEECRSNHSAAKFLLSKVRPIEPILPPAAVTGHIVASILEQQDVRRRLRLGARTALALAAGMLLALCLGYYWLRHNNPESVPSPEDAIVRNKPEPTPSLRDSVAEAGSAMVSLAKRTADETVGQTRLFIPTKLPADSDPGTALLLQPLDQPVRSLREAGQNVSVGFEPVADSARRAMNRFLRDVPPIQATNGF